MSRPVSRRGWMKRMGAGTAALIGSAEAQTVSWRGQDVEIEISALSPQAVRITVLRLREGNPEPLPLDGALVRNPRGAPGARFRTANSRNVKAGALRVDFSPAPLSFTVTKSGGRKIQHLSLDAGRGRLYFDTGTAPLLGLGEGGPQFDRRGNLHEMRSGQGGYRLATHGGKVPIQFLIGTSGWAMYIHRPLGLLDLTGDRGYLKPAEGQSAVPLDVFVIGSGDPAVVMREYAAITGFPEMPPLWSFGYLQSHRTLGPPEEILDEARLFREKKLPCDAMIYLGTDFCPNGWNTHNGEFTWNRKAFPDPRRAIRQLHEQHFKVVLHTVLEGQTLTGTVEDPCTAAPLPSGRTPKGQWPPDRQVGCYWPVHKALLDDGIDGWWPDQGDGLDAPSRLARNRMYFDGTRMYRPDERVFALHRNGYAGMQRYATFLWSGDVQSTWETLKTHIPDAVNTCLSGVPYWGTDIGGFVPTKELTGELYVRWFQFAAFCPLFRSHGRTWKLRLPWGWDTGETGPVETPNIIPESAELHNTQVEPICRKYLELRYRMMPYLYSLVRECTLTGMPILRALWVHYPDDPAAVARGDEYLWGRDLLIAPVVEKGAKSRQLYLPPGSWHDFWTSETVAGGRTITCSVDLETTPLYVRAGAILPLGPVKQYTDEIVDAPIALCVYPGADGGFLLYEDDGRTFAFKRGEWTGIRLAWNDARKTLTLRLAPGSRRAKRRFDVKLGGSVRPVLFEGAPATVTF